MNLLCIYKCVATQVIYYTEITERLTPIDLLTIVGLSCSLHPPEQHTHRLVGAYYSVTSQLIL